MQSRHWVLSLMLATALLARYEPPTRAQSPSENLEDANAFQIAFGMSFYGFDECGDTAAGDLFRKALVEKFDHCPFSAEARRRFHRWADDQTASAVAAMQRYIADHGKLPEQLDGMKLTCAALQRTEKYKKTRDILERYSRGEINVDAIIPDRCDMLSVPP